MKRIGYKQFITEYISGLPYNVPIYTEDVARKLANHFVIGLKQAKTLVNVNLPRIAETHDLVRYQKGIYYKAQNTPFGKTKLNPALINRDLYTQRGGEITGYETGASFLNQIGLTTQIPKYKKYATNAFRQYGCRVNKRRMVIIQKPQTLITEDNYLYLQLLDAIANKDKVTFDARRPEKIILDYINDKSLDFQKLVGYAGKYYSKKTQIRISEIVATGII
jgi:hypothetical protein